MTNKPKHLTPKHHTLVKETIRLILNDEKITEREMDYVRRLYWVVFDTQASDDVIITDLKELGSWTLKNVSK